MARSKPLRVCFITGTRAEFGLMRPVLEAIRAHRGLSLQLIATGVHLDRRLGYTVRQIREAGFRVDATAPWAPVADGPGLARATGRAIASLAQSLERLRSNVVLVVGDRVEAFAGATAGHLCHRLVAHVHGGDRALGQVDDSLRHAITKLAHVHIAATRASAERIIRLGEDHRWVRVVGSPGNDGIRALALPWRDVQLAIPGLSPRGYALLLLHPASAEAAVERRRAEIALRAARQVGFERIVIVYPNNDPGADGILATWERHRQAPDLVIQRSAPRELFLALMRDAAVLVGNSSSGIIEAASFGTPVVDIGPRQLGRQHSGNLVHCGYDPLEIATRLKRIWNRGRPRRSRARNVYGSGGAGRRIADILAGLTVSAPSTTKLIRY